MQPQPENTPDILYKHRYFDSDNYHLNIIRNSSLYFTSADKFNDPYDSTLQFRYSDDPKGIMRKWAVEVMKSRFPDMTKMKRALLVEKRLCEIRADKNYFVKAADYSNEVNLKRFGICSLTPNPENLLMWAHYSFNHTGFCVGFDTKKLLTAQYAMAKTQLIGLRQIQYENDYPKINFFQAMDLSGHGDDIITLLTTKSSEWDYEEEYRLLLWDHINLEVVFSPNIIAEIRLGCRISQENKTTLLNALSKIGFVSRQSNSDKIA